MNATKNDFNEGHTYLSLLVDVRGTIKLKHQPASDVDSGAISEYLSGCSNIYLLLYLPT